MCLCRWRRDRRGALTWLGGERPPLQAARTARGPDLGLCPPSPQVKQHVTDFADPLGDALVEAEAADHRIEGLVALGDGVLRTGQVALAVALLPVEGVDELADEDADEECDE